MKAGSLGGPLRFRWGAVSGLVVLSLGMIGTDSAQAESPSPVVLSVTADGGKTSGENVVTLEQALNAIQEIGKSETNRHAQIIVEIEAGRHTLESPLLFQKVVSGKPASPLIFRGSSSGKSIISGGITITKLEAVDDPKVLDRFPEKAREHVQKYRLKAVHSSPIPGFTAGGAGFAGKREYPYELYQNGNRLPLARWPNKGFAKTGEILGEEKLFRRKKTRDSGVFKFEPNKLEQWASEPDLWMNGKWFNHWADQIFKVKNIDIEAGAIALENPQSHAYGFKENRDFYAFNAFSELDQPGEWVIDRKNRVLYVWPLESASTHPLSLSMTKTLVLGQGVENVRFEKITFEDTTGDAISLNNCSDVVMAGCTVRRTGGWAIHINGGFRCQVIGCDLYDLGEGGVQIKGGEVKSLRPSEHLVENCHIHNIAQRITTYRPGVSLAGVGGIARHNLIYNSPHNALSFDGNDHLFEYNIVHDVAQHASDTGGLYACARNWSKRGTMIRYNMIHALGNPLDGAGCRAFYLDDNTSGVTLHGNIATMSTIGIHVGGGKDNVVTNNLILNSDTSIDYASRGQDSFVGKEVLRLREKHRAYVATLKSPWKTPLWRGRYPKIGDIFEIDNVIDAFDASGNVITDNVMAGGGGVRIQNAQKVLKTSTVENNALVDGDPGLADRENLDFSLSPNEKIAEAKEYEPIPFEKMGLYDSPWRASPAVKFGPNVTPLPAIRTWESFEDARESVPVVVAPPGRVKVNAMRDKNEWTGRFDARTSCVHAVGENHSDHEAFSQAIFDHDAFYIYVNIEHARDVPLKLDGEWGERDGFEIALSDPRDPGAPTFLIQGYPDSTFKVIPVGLTTKRQAQVLEESMEYASRQGKGNWTAEMRLPLSGLDMSEAELTKVNYNINVRRMADESWMVWIPPTGNFWEVSKAGLLKLPTFE